MKHEDRAFIGPLFYGAKLVGITVLVLFVVDMVQYAMGSRQINWDREIEFVGEGLFFLLVGFLGEAIWLSKRKK